ncbi:Protein of unknown function [Cotesia congregata]|uniref:Uncharacterized protein n=1 Tax=Cotesia congregata TaxID=51543 RepID=A0A8J2HFB1_COTCN|nr:Protein of unknown function [Cotesia congregata]
MNCLQVMLLLVFFNGLECIENLHPVSNRSQVSEPFLPGLNLTDVANNSVSSKKVFKSSVAEKDSDFRPSEHLGAIEPEEVPTSTIGNRIKFPLATASSLSSNSGISRRKIVPYESPVKAETVVSLQPPAKQRIKFIYDYQRKQNDQQPQPDSAGVPIASEASEDDDNSYHEIQGEGYVVVHPPAPMEDVNLSQPNQEISSEDKPDKNQQENQEPQYVVNHSPDQEVNNHQLEQETTRSPEISYHQSYGDSDERHPNWNNNHHSHYHYSLPEVNYPKQTQHAVADPPYHYQYQYVVPESTGLEKPEMNPYYHQYYLQNPGHMHQEVVIDKPEAVVYLSSHRETSFTRTRKFPYKYYHPQEQATEVHYPNHGYGYAIAPQQKQISPWNKIIHLIGAFLPLGLLIAALKPPNVVKIDGNTSQPNIVLSKLRAIHLPLEHKTSLESFDEEEDYKENNNKFADYDYNKTCEDKSICEIILRGADKSTDLLSQLKKQKVMSWKK